jgi:hypothetical protein
MAPTKVMMKGGGPWWPWTSGSVDPAILKMRQGSGDTCYVNGCQVHALKFEDGSIWTAKHGWSSQQQGEAHGTSSS